MKVRSMNKLRWEGMLNIHWTGIDHYPVRMKIYLGENWSEFKGLAWAGFELWGKLNCAVRIPVILLLTYRTQSLGSAVMCWNSYKNYVYLLNIIISETVRGTFNFGMGNLICKFVTVIGRYLTKERLSRSLSDLGGL